MVVGLAFVGFVGFFAYDAFLKPPTIVGTWKGSMLDFEIGRPIVRTEYALLLDEQKHVSMTLQEQFTSTGTYVVKGNRLVLTLKDEDGETSERVYKIALGRVTLNLFDPTSDKKLVELIRFREPPAIAKETRPREAPKDLAADAVEKVDKAADESLASVEYAPKDGAFRVRYPKGWEADTGSRPDNTYSWASFTRGSAKIQVFADVTGSLVSGSGSNHQYEEGSELAPVHSLHTMYQKTVSKEYSDFKESQPAL